MLYEVLRWEEKAILDAAKEMGLELEPIHLYNTILRVGENGLKSSALLSSVEIALQRAISHAIALNSTIALESLGIRVINSSMSTAIAMNKLWTLSILSRNNIKTPRTLITFSEESCYKAAQVIGYPVVLKPIDGSWGRLISMARDEEELRSVIEHRNYIPNPSMKVHMIQEFVNKPNRDIRVFVIGDEVPTAIYRVNNHWITNTARGGKAEPAKIDDELRELVLKTAKLIGIEIAGIDVFEDMERGYVVNEINAVPEFKNTVAATGVKLQLKIAEYIKTQLRK
uniref:Lysine biosynthesis protein LysX n=1 Tax=Ignisphaera aggregans TaxID=334771 RepID=A0A7J2U473_9CREN